MNIGKFNLGINQQREIGTAEEQELNLDALGEYRLSQTEKQSSTMDDRD